MLEILLLADTHIGFDLPRRPRVKRRRRGEDFLANFERALAPARAGEIDLVVHGGDLLFRSRVPPALVRRALEPLLRVADGGVPVVLVPGNHERSAIPYPLFAAHPRLFVLDRPQALSLTLRGQRVAVAGFPCVRDDIRDRFARLYAETGGASRKADIRLLCLHQTVEGATVGPVEYVFRRGPDVIRGRDLPAGLAAVLAGHIHRHQVLTHNLPGRPLAAPVFYPGSIERVSRAEADEPKGFLRLTLEPGPNGGNVARWRFCPLPARPMIDVELVPDGLDAEALAARLGRLLTPLDPDAVVRVKLTGPVNPRAARALAAAKLRELAPDSMNVTIAWPRRRRD